MTTTTTPQVEAMVKRLKDRREELERWREGLRCAKDDYFDLELWMMGDAMDAVFAQLGIDGQVQFWLLRKMVLSLDPAIRNILVGLATDHVSWVYWLDNPNQFDPIALYKRGQKHEQNLQTLRDLCEQEEKAGGRR